MIRAAMVSDAPALAELAALHRREYARAQPQFWRAADGALEAHRAWLTRLIEDQSTLTLVAEHAGDVVGLLVADLVDPPPVYDPGGPTGFVDDFVVSASDQWDTVGRELLVAAREWLTDKGAAQIVVVAGFHDGSKRALLDAEGLSVASTWHVASLTTGPGKGPEEAP